MKLIDNNGKVFGIINIIDLTASLFLISAITGFSWLVYTGELFSDHDPARKLFVEKEIELFLTNQQESTVIKLKDTMQKTINDTNALIRVTNITSNKHCKRDLTNNTTDIICIYNVNLNLKLKTQIDKSTNEYYFYNGGDEKNYKDIKLEINKTVNIIILQTSLIGTITKIS